MSLARGNPFDTSSDRALRIVLRAAAAVVAFAVSAALPAQQVTAESLHQALTSAYETNPTLDAQRARLRATDETIARARSGWRPRVTGRANYGHERLKTKPQSTSSGRSAEYGYGLNITQPLFDGFRTRSAVNQAEARVREERARLRLAEASVLLDAATAYMNVVRDQMLVRLNEANVGVLTKELRAARARRAVREVTRTDVAQAEARRARALSALDEARAALKASRADYRRVVGHDPQGLRKPPMKLKLVPRTLDTAIQFSTREAPRVHLALYREAAARHEVDQIWGELLPQVRIEGDFEKQHSPGFGTREQESASISGRVTVPLYAGGETRARVREAKHQHVGRLQEIEQARRDVESRTTAAWSRLKAGRARIESDRIQVRASQTALDGVRAEQAVGQRTLLDVLNAEQELLEAKAALIRTERNAVVAQYTLLAEMGRLDADMLRLSTAIYDPEAHYEDAKGKWLTTSIAQPIPVSEEEAELTNARQAWRVRPAPRREIIEPEEHAPRPLSGDHAPLTTGSLRSSVKPAAPAARWTSKTTAPVKLRVPKPTVVSSREALRAPAAKKRRARPTLRRSVRTVPVTPAQLPAIRARTYR
ncbi:MAG: TolC family outer membrane protein [Pseudomonadota bacterium]